MKRSQKINAFMYKLLIEKNMDNFSVVEARDAALLIEGIPPEPDEARKLIYRQIFLFEKKGWLSSDGTGRQKKYFQTEQFKELSFVSKDIKTKRDTTSKTVRSTIHDYSVLVKERGEYQGELEIILGEIEEYQSLNQRFPELNSKINPLLKSARERSALLLGKINVLTHVLSSLSEECSLC